MVDTPPLAEAEARAAMRVADLVLVPCRPNAFDLHAIKLTADMVSLAGKPAFVVFNAGPAVASRLYGETAELVTGMGMQIAPIRVSERATFRHATGSGKSAQEVEPAGKAAEEIAEAWKWIRQHVNMKARGRVDTSTKVPA